MDMSEKFKLCIAGKNNIAVDVLEYILKNSIFSNNEIVVVCNRTEDGRNTWQKSLRYFAKLWQVKEVSLEDVYKLKDIYFLSLEFDRIIRPEKFRTRHLYNIHFSKLPQYKGCFTAIMPLLNLEKVSGVTFHRMNAGIDTGEIIDQIEFPIHVNDTSRDLYFKCLSYGTELVIRQLPKIKNNDNLFGVMQDAIDASYYSKNAIDFSKELINIKKTASEICAQLRAFTFREYQLPKISGKNVVKAEITDIPSCKPPGTIIWQDEWRGIMATIDYDIVIYWDAFAYVMRESAEGNLDNLCKVPHLECYVNQSEEHGWTPLIVAAYHGHYEAFMLLVANGAKLQQRNWNGTTLLMYAKDGWRKNKDGRIFQYLKQRGLSLDDIDYSGKCLKDYSTDEEWMFLSSL